MSAAIRLREILESAGLAQERLSADAIESAQVIARVANLLNIRDTEMSRFGALLCPSRPSLSWLAGGNNRLASILTSCWYMSNCGCQFCGGDGGSVAAEGRGGGKEGEDTQGIQSAPGIHEEGHHEAQRIEEVLDATLLLDSILHRNFAFTQFKIAENSCHTDKCALEIVA